MPGLSHVHLEHTTLLLCGQSASATGQGSKHYLVAFYNKPDAAAVYSFDTRVRTGLEFVLKRQTKPLFSLLYTAIILVVSKNEHFTYRLHSKTKVECIVICAIPPRRMANVKISST